MIDLSKDSKDCVVMTMKIKLSDLAKELDISVAAVSMALNQKKGVSDETRDKVLELAREKGYKIKEIPLETEEELDVKRYIKLLRIQKHGLVAIDTAFFSSLIDGIDVECKKNNIELIVSNVKFADLSPEWIQSAFDNTVSGAIILATELETGDVTFLDGIDVPFIILDSYFPGKEWDFVLMNNNAAIYQAVDYLIKSGHQKIGYIKSNTHIYNFGARFSSYREALEQKELVYDPKYTFEIEPTLDGAHRDMLEIINHQKDLSFPTAFISDNDIIAAGAMSAFAEKDIKVPEHISVIGIDDMPFAQMIQPKLTTCRIYKHEIGITAVKILLKKLNGDEMTTCKTEINSHLVIRQSVHDRT